MSKEKANIPSVPVDVTEQTIGLEHDQYGHINYKDYPELFEPGQDAYIAARGLTFEGIEQRYGLRSVVPTYTVSVRSESHKGDRVQVETRVDRVGNSSFTYGQTMKRGEILIAELSMVVVLIDKEGKPSSIPSDIRNRLQDPVEK